MDSHHQLVGCVLASTPAARQIDEFVALARRHQAEVVAKDAQGLTFVRFGTPDGALLSLACRAAAVPSPAALRFGFATGVQDPSQRGRGSLGVNQTSIAQASDLAVAARDGEVLATGPLASLLIEAGFDLRTRTVTLPGGRTIAACSLDLRREGSAAAPPAEPKRVRRPAPDAPGPASAPVEQRLASLDAAADQVQRLLDTQHARLAELDRLGARFGHLPAQMAELEGRLGALHDLADRLAPLAPQLHDLSEALAHARGQLPPIEARLAELEQRGRGLEQRLATCDETLARIEGRRPSVDEVHSRAQAITHLLADVNVNLEMLSEQRAVIDHVGDKLARLDFTVQEAQNTLRALQREREVAERIEQGIKALRARPIAGPPAV